MEGFEAGKMEEVGEAMMEEMMAQFESMGEKEDYNEVSELVTLKGYTLCWFVNQIDRLNCPSFLPKCLTSFLSSYIINFITFISPFPLPPSFR